MFRILLPSQMFTFVLVSLFLFFLTISLFTTSFSYYLRFCSTLFFLFTSSSLLFLFLPQKLYLLFTPVLIYNSHYNSGLFLTARSSPHEINLAHRSIFLPTRRPLRRLVRPALQSRPFSPPGRYPIQIQTSLFIIRVCTSTWLLVNSAFSFAIDLLPCRSTLCLVSRFSTL